MKKSIIVLILSSFFLGPVVSFAEINNKQWSVRCDSQKNCFMGINATLDNQDKKKIIISNIFIEVGTIEKNSMQLINKESQTYKMVKVKESTPFLFANLPMGIDLSTKPFISIDGKDIVQLNHLNCNKKRGCQSNTKLNTIILNSLKSGKLLTVTANTSNKTKNLAVEVPLKNFTKSYNKLIKNY